MFIWLYFGCIYLYSTVFQVFRTPLTQLYWLKFLYSGSIKREEIQNRIYINQYYMTYALLVFQGKENNGSHSLSIHRLEQTTEIQKKQLLAILTQS